MTDTYELRTSQYDHPERQPGQHTNGPAKLFIRRPGGPWYRVRYQTPEYKVSALIATYGWDYFTLSHCTLASPEPPQ